MTEAQRASLKQRIAELISRLADGGQDPAARDALLLEVAAFQRERVAPYANLLRGVADGAPWPALPTDVFRYVRVAGHLADQDIAVFRTSGTTSGLRGSHALRDLSLYDLAAESAARYALFPGMSDVQGGPGAVSERSQIQNIERNSVQASRMPRLIVLAPEAAIAPDSSLSYMLQRFTQWFACPEAGPAQFVFGEQGVHVPRLHQLLLHAQQTGCPVALLGTSFAFVHADDGLGDHRFALPAGSRIMQTGGFKGKSRTLSPVAMGAMLCSRYGVPAGAVTQEYGMTELCSQMYGAALRYSLLGQAPLAQGAGDALWVPGWVRATPVHAETLQPVADGEVGILRVDDLANLDSVSAIQTNDLARWTPEGLRLLGRAPGAVARGCSLSVEEALGGEV